jgi:hypothetical protein
MSRTSWRPNVASCHQRIFGRRLMNETSSVIWIRRMATIVPKTIQNTMSAVVS